MRCVYWTTTNLLTQLFLKEVGATQRATPHTPTPSIGVLRRIRLHLGAHLAPIQIIGSPFEQRPTSLCLDNVQNTPGPLVDAHYLLRIMGLRSDESMMAIWGQ